MKRLLSVLVATAAGTFLWAQPNDSLLLSEVVVTGTRQATDIRHLPMTVTVIDRSQLTAQNRTSVLPTLAEAVPGLMLTQRGMLGFGVSNGAAGGLNMRGLAGGGGRMLVLIDGHPQYSNIYGHPISDSYQTMMAERIEVLHGPASVLYGSNAMGGVVNIVTRGNLRRDTAMTHLNLGAGSWGTVQAELANQTRHGRWNSTVAMQYQRSDNHRPRMGFEQAGGFARLGYDVAPHWSSYAEMNLTRFKGSDPNTTEQPYYDRDQWITRGEATLALENNYARTSGALRLYTSFGHHRIDDGWYEGRVPGGPDQRDYYFRSTDRLMGIALYQSMTLFEGNRLTAGFDYQHSYGKAYNTSKLTNEVTNAGLPSYGESHRNEVGAYVDVRQDLLQWLTIDAGIRLNHHQTAGTEWVPQVGVVGRLLQGATLKALVSKGFRNPTMRELYLYAMANDQLKPERLWNYELSWRHNVGRRFAYGLNLFYVQGSNLILSTMVDGRRRNMNSGTVKNLGAELDATWRVDSHWTLTTNHSLLKQKDQQVAAAPKYKGYLGVRFNEGPWQAQAGLQFIHGLGLDKNGDGLTDLDEKNIVLLSASASYQLTRHLALWLRGENLLARKYALNYGYPMPRATFMGGVNIGF